MTDDPRDVGSGPDIPPPGRVTTAAHPHAPDPEAVTSDVAEIEVAEIEVVDIEVIEEEPVAADVSRPAAHVETARVDVPPDEADTVELAQADLHEAARAAGVELQPNVDQPDPDEPAVADAALADAAPDPDARDPSGAPIDPRIRERRIAVTRAQGRRRLRILLAVVAVASVIGIAWLIVMSPFLAVDDVTIQGTLHESPESVRAAADVSDGSALLFVDTGAVARRIEKLPWISEAKVERELPNGLKITVVERAPVAWVRRPAPSGSPRGAEGPVAIVDATGRVLGDEPSPPVGLPEIEGTERLAVAGGRISPARPALAVALLPPALRAQVSSLTRHRGQPVLVLGGDDPVVKEIRLGRLEDVMAKGAAALAVLDQLVTDEAHKSYIDVRVPGAPATR